MAEPRQLTPAEKARGFTSVVYVRQAGRTPGMGYETIDIETGRSIGTISKISLARRRAVGGRKFRGELFVETPPTPEVAVSIRRAEETKYEREMAEKRAEREVVPVDTVREQEKRIADLSARMGYDVIKTREGYIFKDPRTGQVVDRPSFTEIAQYPYGRDVMREQPPPREIAPEELVREVMREREQERRKEVKILQPSEIGIAPKPEGIIETIKEKKRRLEYKVQREKGLERQVLSFGALGLGVVTGIVEPIRHPIQFVKGLYRTVTHPRETGLVIGQELRQRPAGLIGQIIGTRLLFKGISKVVPKPTIPTIRTGKIADVKTTIIKFRGDGLGKAIGFRAGKRAIIIGRGGEIAPSPPPPFQVTGTQLIVPSGVPIERALVPSFFKITPPPPPTPPSIFLAPKEIIAQKVLFITPTAPPKVVTEIITKVIPTQFDIYGRPIIPKPKIKAPITTMIGKDIIVDIVKPSPPITLQRIDVMGAVPVFTKIADVPARFREIGRDIQIKLPGEESKLVVYDPVTNKIRLLGREDIRAEGGGFLGEREVFFKDNGRFVESERFRVLGEVSPESREMRFVQQLRPSVEVLDTAKQRTLEEMFFKKEKKEISVKEFEKRIGKKISDILRPKEEVAPPTKEISFIRDTRPTIKRPELYKVQELEMPTREAMAKYPFIQPELMRGAITVTPVFRRVAERFGFRPLERVTPREIARARITPREIARRVALPAMVTPTQVSAARTSLLLGLTPTQEQLRLTEQLKAQEKVNIQEQLKIQEQIKVTEQVGVQEQLKVQEQIKIQEQVQIQEQLQVLEQLSITEQLAITTQIGITPTVPVTGVPPPPIVITTPKEGIKFVGKVSKKKEGFDVMVREGERRTDRFKRVAKNLPRHKALKKGRDIVDNYIEATYRINPSGKTTEVTDDLTAPILSKFRRPVPKSKLPRDSLIEMVKHRIDTLGEKQQLSYFKELARKKQALQTQISFIKTQQVKQRKKQQLQSMIATKQTQQIGFISSSKKSTKKRGRGRIKFL